jgi:hypothetical protein
MSTMPAPSSRGPRAPAAVRTPGAARTPEWVPRTAPREQSPELEGVELRWRLPACGLRCASLPADVAYTGGDLWVVVRVEPQTPNGQGAQAWCVHAHLQGAKKEQPSLWSTSCRAATVAQDGDLVHIDAPGMLSATLRRDSQGLWRAIYARTGSLATLGIPGGRAEFEGAGQA